MYRKASMLCVLALLLCFGSVAAAQEQTVSIQGGVKDASGAVLPGATVEARNRQAGTNTAITSPDRRHVRKDPAAGALQPDR